jgi:ribose transport system substrate-binding protein
MESHRRFGPRLRFSALVALIGGVLMVVVAAGCGGSSSGGSASSDKVKQAEQIAQQAEKRPTSIGLTTPLNKPVPTGKQVFYITCGPSACATQASIFKDAAQQFGWSLTTINTDGSPEQEQNAFETALRKGADAVILNAADRATLSKQIAEAKAKGVPLVTCCTPDKVGDGIIYNTSTPEQNGKIGDYLAAKIIADSKGKANTLYVNISAFKILAALGTSFKSTYQKYCPKCGYANLDVPLTSLGKDAPDRIVGYLRSHPNVNYVALSIGEGLGAGLPAALNAAGLGSKVKVVSQGADTTTYQYIKSGQQQAAVPFDYFTVDWLMMDALARHWAGLPVRTTSPPHWIMTQSAVPSTSKLFPVVSNYQEQFKKLWGKASST